MCKLISAKAVVLFG